MLNNPVRGDTPGLPGETLSEIHDCLVLALDASENRRGYSLAEREARSYIRRALRLIGEPSHAAA